jgi:2-C-methyl-D-erythritol 4-phosphate cytidylyltransferase
MFLGVKLVDGGSERFESVANALATVREDVDFVVVHDAVRPCTKPTDIDRVFATAEKYGAALLGIPVVDTLKRLDEDRKIIETVPRRGLWQAQTPQIGRKDWLLDAYAKRSTLKAEITDDAQLLEAMGHPVVMVEGSPTNLKITTKDDMLIAQAVLAAKFGEKVVKQYHPFADEDGNW